MQPYKTRVQKLGALIINKTLLGSFFQHLCLLIMGGACGKKYVPTNLSSDSSDSDASSATSSNNENSATTPTATTAATGKTKLTTTMNTTTKTKATSPMSKFVKGDTTKKIPLSKMPVGYEQQFKNLKFNKKTNMMSVCTPKTNVTSEIDSNKSSAVNGMYSNKLFINVKDLDSKTGLLVVPKQKAIEQKDVQLNAPMGYSYTKEYVHTESPLGVYPMVDKLKITEVNQIDGIGAVAMNKGFFVNKAEEYFMPGQHEMVKMEQVAITPQEQKYQLYYDKKTPGQYKHTEIMKYSASPQDPMVVEGNRMMMVNYQNQPMKQAYMVLPKVNDYYSYLNNAQVQNKVVNYYEENMKKYASDGRVMAPVAIVEPPGQGMAMTKVKMQNVACVGPPIANIAYIPNMQGTLYTPYKTAPSDFAYSAKYSKFIGQTQQPMYRMEPVHPMVKMETEQQMYKFGSSQPLYDDGKMVYKGYKLEQHQGAMMPIIASPQVASEYQHKFVKQMPYPQNEPYYHQNNQETTLYQQQQQQQPFPQQQQHFPQQQHQQFVQHQSQTQSPSIPNEHSTSNKYAHPISPLNQRPENHPAPPSPKSRVSSTISKRETIEHIECLRREIKEIKNMISSQNNNEILNKIEQLILNFDQMRKTYHATVRDVYKDNYLKSQIGQSESVFGQKMNKIRADYNNISSKIDILSNEAIRMVHSLKKNPSNVYSSSVKGLKTQEIKELNNQMERLMRAINTLKGSYNSEIMKTITKKQ